MTTTAKRDSLRSWKAIAAYLGCSVRSARRWEAEEGLPVHRQMHKSQGTVYAYADELDAWQKRGETGPARAARSEPDRSIAVLPLSYVGPDPANEYIADGFTDEIIADLSKIRALRVISRTSSMALKGTRKDARSIARSLNVRFLLEGTVRQQHTTLRISTRLIDPASDDRLWSNNYDGNIDEVFAIQETIARDVAGALHLQLTVDDDHRLSERKVDDVAAWRYALEARQQALRWRPDSIDQAVSLLQKAVEIAGEVPSLLGALGRAWLHYREAGIDTGPEPLRQAEHCRERIAAIDADAAAGLQLAGWIAYSRGDLKAAVRNLNLAMREEPNDPDTLGLLANCYILSGRTALARPVIERHLAIDPLTPLTRCLPGFAEAFEGNFSKAIGPYREMYEADPGNPLGRLFLIWILASAGERDEALALAAGFPQFAEGSPPGRIAALFAAGLSGDTLEGGPVTPEDVAALAGSGDMFPRLLAQAHALAGDTEAAIHWLAIAVERGFINYPFIAEHDPMLDGIRDEVAFRDLLADVRTRWERFDDA